MSKEVHPDELAKLCHPFYMVVWFIDKPFTESKKMIFTLLTTRHNLMDMLVESKKAIQWNTKYYDRDAKEALISETTVKERSSLNPEETFIKEALVRGWEFDMDTSNVSRFLKSIENKNHSMGLSAVEAMYLKAICKHRNEINKIV